MDFINFENFLRASIFLVLLGTMFFYWIKATFFSINNNSFFEILLLVISNLLFMVLLLIRWIETKHFPLSNLYESLIFLCWSLNCFLLYLQIKFKENSIGILISPLILFINTFASFSLPIEMQKASSLVPALQSNWLMMHVTIMMLSYAALILGSLLSIAFLVVKNLVFTNKESEIEIDSIINQTYQPFYQLKKSVLTSPISLEKNIDINESINNKILLLKKFDNLSYRLLGIGFPLLTIGILSGAVWANETWGSYWSWDPKETWALITWLVFAIYLHSRIIKNWTGEKPAFIASFGFLIVWICYLGVNIFGKGLHSYGWFS